MVVFRRVRVLYAYIFVLELYILIVASLIYTIWTHTFLYNQLQSPLPSSTVLSQSHRTASQRPSDSRDVRHNSVAISPIKKDHFSFVWMTVPKNYR